MRAQLLAVREVHPFRRLLAAFVSADPKPINHLNNDRKSPAEIQGYDAVDTSVSSRSGGSQNPSPSHTALRSSGQEGIRLPTSLNHA